VARAAFERGRGLAAGETGRDGVLRVLEAHGFEPRADGEGIALANCPFHTLAQEQTELVCGMNLRLLQGVLDAVADAGLVAQLRPEPGRCCVRLEPVEGSEPTG
jgi:predicted ArsR family transcriptional regulator